MKQSLCDQCAYNFIDYTNEVIRPALKDAGLDFKSIWCGVTDQPEDERWETCDNFKERRHVE